MNKSIFYYKQLTAAEVGTKGTHEIYVRLSNNFDTDDFFQCELSDNGEVLEYTFQAKNLTEGHEDDDLVTLRFVYFVKSNHEKRIPSLGDLFKKNDVTEADVVRLENRVIDNKSNFYITFIKPGDIQIHPNQFYYSIIESQKDNNKVKCNKAVNSYQTIYFGAPGTGKSHRINSIVDKDNCVRTTFHPDSDYSAFVGAYKPTMEKTGVIRNGKEETKISYTFVPQAFLKAYIAAWTKLEVDFYLVIEEINRGNCAQIFGDLFQLLDRKDGVSEYPIKADNDLCTYLEDKLPKGCEGIENGELKLPNNLYIFATMNTSDQSLFPIDSAFKRRWDWKYIPIRNGNKEWKISAGGYEYDWWKFIEKINPVIGDATESEDKKLGYFFAKAGNDNIISTEKFVSKVIFYLYNDVFKDNEVDGELLIDNDTNKPLTFESFFNNDGSAKESKVVMFLDKLGVEKVSGKKAEDEANE